MGVPPIHEDEVRKVRTWLDVKTLLPVWEMSPMFVEEGDIVGSGSPVRTAFPRRGRMHLLPGFGGSSASLVSPFPSPESQLPPPTQAAATMASDASAVAQTPTPPRSSFSTSQLSLPLHILRFSLPFPSINVPQLINLHEQSPRKPAAQVVASRFGRFSHSALFPFAS